MPLEQVPSIDPEADQKILQELAEPLVPLINRHINPSRFKDPAIKHEFPTVTDYMGDNADQWVPAMMVPWSMGENYPANYVWKPEESPLPEAARAAFIIGLLTEDALPWYSEGIVRRFGANKAMRFFAGVWTAEEGRHADVIAGHMIVGRFADPIQIERDRMANVISQKVPDPPSAMESLIYVSLQELATRHSHQNTGILIADTEKFDESLYKLSADKTKLANVEPTNLTNLEPEERASYLRQVTRTIMTRVAGDENKHHVFYRDAVTEAIKIDPSTVVKAIERQFREFQMPGYGGIPNFERLALKTADAGVFDPPIMHSNLTQMWNKWDVESLEGLDGEAEQARERTAMYLGQLGVDAARFTDRRKGRRAKYIDDPTVIWVGKEAA